MRSPLTTVLTLFLFIQIACFLTYAAKFCVRNFLVQERRLQALYGPRTWVLVTGCGSGQGRRFAIEFAKRGFHVALCGRASILRTQKHMTQKYPNVQTKALVMDFCDATQPHFFTPIEEFVSSLQSSGQQLSVLVNNIGHRVAWKPYHSMPEHLIHNSIVCGTLVQSRLTQIALRHFITRPAQYKSLIVNVTANCFYSNFWFGKENHISLPYLSVYEGANAFGFYHSNSIEKEYGDVVDVLNIMPGAVVTENTQMLSNTPFRIDAKTYVQNVFKLMGNYTGPQFAHWGHELSSILCNLIPPVMRDCILEETASKITSAFMAKELSKGRDEKNCNDVASGAR
jgi:short-subunit dehydrogenase